MNEDTPISHENTPEPGPETPASPAELRQDIAELREAVAGLDWQIAEALEVMRRGGPPIDLEEKYLMKAKLRRWQGEVESQLAAREPPEPPPEPA
jgi:hypothetical protein